MPLLFLGGGGRGGGGVAGGDRRPPGVRRSSTAAAPADRISGVAPLLPTPPGSPGTHPAPLAGIVATSTAGGGWLESLLEKAGVSPSSAHTAVQFIARPLEVVLVLVIGALVARYGAKAVRRALGRLAAQATSRRGSTRAGARMATVGALVANVWRFAVLVVAVAIVLGMLGVDLAPLLASATLIGATIGFGAQSLVRDYLSGILLTMEDQFGIGDTLTVGGTTGVVEDLTLRVTRLRAPDGSLWYVPNGDIRTLGNGSRGWARAIVDVPVPAGPTDALERAKSSVAAAARQVAEQLGDPSATEPPDVVGVVAADASTCTLRVALRTSPGRRTAAERALREAVVARLVADGVWAIGDGPATGPAPPAGAGLPSG